MRLIFTHLPCLALHVVTMAPASDTGPMEHHLMHADHRQY